MGKKKQYRMAANAASGSLSWAFVNTFKVFSPFFSDVDPAKAKTISPRAAAIRKLLQMVALLMIAGGLFFVAMVVIS